MAQAGRDDLDDRQADVGPRLVGDDRLDTGGSKPLDEPPDVLGEVARGPCLEIQRSSGRIGARLEKAGVGERGVIPRREELSNVVDRHDSGGVLGALSLGLNPIAEYDPSSNQREQLGGGDLAPAELSHVE